MQNKVWQFSYVSIVNCTRGRIPPPHVHVLYENVRGLRGLYEYILPDLVDFVTYRENS